MDFIKQKSGSLSRIPIFGVEGCVGACLNACRLVKLFQSGHCSHDEEEDQDGVGRQKHVKRGKPPGPVRDAYCHYRTFDHWTHFGSFAGDLWILTQNLVHPKCEKSPFFNACLLQAR